MNCIRNERKRPHTPQHSSAQPTVTGPTNNRPVRPATVQQEMQSFMNMKNPKKQCSGLTEDQRAAVNDLALEWDLPVLTEAYRTWLLHNLLHHALKQFKQGLKESLILPLLESRPDTVAFSPVSQCLNAVVLDHIKWPEEGGLEDDDDRDEREGEYTAGIISVYFYCRRGVLETFQRHAEISVLFSSLQLSLSTQTSRSFRAERAFCESLSVINSTFQATYQ
ncbi:hypothetical protein G5714_022068 [Onychostoma macrolepis]|uniref:Uncharacterized protein n=1 Tax=Onychostoma macrolepis TaxID=369639 RepID=A0A7J6BST2_9TELE|nr:hypothetical protein G5714_022068 [Onychostoma macrolepis]